jgi:hypothetical protein
MTNHKEALNTIETPILKKLLSLSPADLYKAIKESVEERDIDAVCQWSNELLYTGLESSCHEEAEACYEEIIKRMEIGSIKQESVKKPESLRRKIIKAHEESGSPFPLLDFGKHDCESIDKVPSAYLRYLTSTKRGEWPTLARREIRRRRLGQEEVLDFGKYAGVPLKEVPSEYFYWIANESGCSMDRKKLARQELKARKALATQAPFQTSFDAQSWSANNLSKR